MFLNQVNHYLKPYSKASLHTSILFLLTVNHYQPFKISIRKDFRGGASKKEIPKQILEEYDYLHKESEDGKINISLEKIKNDPMKWQIKMKGPLDTPLQNTDFLLTINFS